MISGLPSTTRTSRSNAFMLFFLWAFLTFLCASFICFLSATLLISASRVSTSRRAYQTSRLCIAANSRIASRYERTVLRTAARVCFGVKSRSRPAISKLAARRLTSHSQGPGRVSSKSLTSNTRLRSGAAKTPKFERWASPQSCTWSPD